MRILLADRDEAFLEIVQTFLWDRGHEAEIAASGAKCAAIWRAFQPHVLVLDRDLIGGNSQTFLARMDADIPLKNTPIILTSDGEIPDEVIATAGLPVACLRKPYRLSELLKQIDKARRDVSSSVPAAESV
jgi:DNA-binding response OmpR family regulator